MLKNSSGTTKGNLSDDFQCDQEQERGPGSRNVGSQGAGTGGLRRAWAYCPDLGSFILFLTHWIAKTVSCSP